MKLDLIIDDREQNIWPVIDGIFAERLRNSNTEEKLSLSYRKMRMTTGDFAITIDDKIVAVFERKTLSDFAAGFKDGRYNNQNKMLELRKTTQCQLYYIIENHNAFPDYKRKYAHIEYKHINAAIMQLMVRHGIHVVLTESVKHTAEKLIEFLHYYYTSRELFCETLPEDNIESNAEKTSRDIEDTISPSADFLLTQKTELSTKDIASMMWASIPFVSIPLAVTLNKICDINSTAEYEEEIRQMRTPIGRKLSSRAVKNILNLNNDKKTQKKILTCVPLVSKNVADCLLNHCDFADICTAENLEDIPIGNKKLGIKRANKIRECLQFKIT